MSDIRIAIETALAAMPPMLAVPTILSSSIAASTVITTSTPHLLATGLYVNIAGHTGSTPAISGTFKVTVLSSVTFSIPLAVSVGGTGGAATAQLSAWENIDFAPLTGIPYQAGQLIPSQPWNLEYGAAFLDTGIYQINLAYPAQVGANAAETRARLIQTTFKRGASFTANGTTLIITRTPFIMPGYPSPGCWVLPVRIYYQAQVAG